MKAPSADELAAIAAALAVYERSAEERQPAAAAWTLAMRRPELEFEELLALRHACSTRF